MRLVFVVWILSLIPASLVGDGTVSVDVERIGDRVVVVRCPVGSNVTAINTARGVVIVDTHLSPGLMRAMKSVIEGVFDTVEFPYVINTHGHWDHCSGNQVFPEATIVGHANSSVFMRHHRANTFGTIETLR